MSTDAPTGTAADGGAGEVVVSTGELATTDMVLNIGPQHPATHGVLRLRLRLDGERIVHCEPIIGYMHRGAEKLFEVRDYRQIIVLANRHDWLSAFANELGVVLAVERMLGMEVPVRAVWARTLLAELNRVLSHLMFLGSYPLEVGAITPVFYAFREREALQAVMEEVSGGRMHFMFNRVGGLKEDLPAGWTGRARQTVADVRRRLPALRDLVLGNDIFQARTRGVGRLSVGAGAAVRRQRSHRARHRRPDRPAPRRALPRVRRARDVGSSAPGDQDRGRLLREVRGALGADRRVARPRRRLPRPDGAAAARTDQRAAAQGAEGAGGRDVRVDREPARHQRLLPGLARREDAVAAQAAVSVVQQRAVLPELLQGACRRHGR